MQPYLFPYIGYFQLINAVDIFVIFDDVNFIKRGWINRNRILVNGKEYMFVVPLKKASQNKKIREIEITSDNKWRKRFLKTIEYHYKKATYFSNVMDLITRIINTKEINLSSFTHRSLILICEYLCIRTKIIDSSSKYQNEFLKAEKRIIDICKKEKADHYINPIGGLNFYRREDFSEHGIKLSFLKTKEIIYNQLSKPFVRNLSIIDVMMNNSISSIRRMLNQYELI